jgi:hypothetical protein
MIIPPPHTEEHNVGFDDASAGAPEEWQLPITYAFHIAGYPEGVKKRLSRYNFQHAKLYHLHDNIYLWARPFGSLQPQEKWYGGEWGNMLGIEPQSLKNTGLKEHFYKASNSVDTIHDSMTKQREQLYTAVIVLPTTTREPEYFGDISTTTDQTTNIYLWKNDHTYYTFHYSIARTYKHSNALRDITHVAPVNDGMNLALASDTTLHLVEALTDKEGDKKVVIVENAHDKPQSTFVSSIPLLTDQELNQGRAVESIEWPDEKKSIIACLRPTGWIEQLLKQPIKKIDPMSGAVDATWRFHNPLMTTLSVLYSLCKSTLIYLWRARPY